MKRVTLDVLFAFTVLGLIAGSFLLFSHLVLEHDGPLLVFFRGQEVELLTP